MSHLRELPVPVSFHGDIALTYCQERDQLTGPVQLPEFIQRWRAIWGLADGAPPCESCQALATGTAVLDYAQAWQCMQQCRQHDQGCEHVTSPAGCVGMHLMLPGVLAIGTVMAQHFGTTVNVAVIQLQRAHGNLDDEDEDVIHSEVAP